MRSAADIRKHGGSLDVPVGVPITVLQSVGIFWRLALRSERIARIRCDDAAERLKRGQYERAKRRARWGQEALDESRNYLAQAVQQLVYWAQGMP